MRLADYDAILFDMDGTLYHEHHALPGAADLLDYLRRTGQRHAFVTNNSSNTAAELAQRLTKLHMQVPAQDIYTAGAAMADWVRAWWTNSLSLRERAGVRGGTALGSDPVTASPLTRPEYRPPSSAGRGEKPRVLNFAGTALPCELGHDAILVDRLEQGCDVVAVGSHMRELRLPFDFDRALLGLEFLRRGAQLLVGCSDRVFPIQGGGVEFGSGSWGALFAFAANLPPSRLHYAGKPELSFFQQLCHRIGVAPARCLLVGDNLEADIGGGQGAGMATALLLSGVTRRQDLAKSPVQPNFVFDDLAHLLRQANGQTLKHP